VTDNGTPGFAAGFTSLDTEITVDRLPVTGSLPDWLAGTLVRNGPAYFDGGRHGFRHWFDGQAMLHRFTFAAGEVSYANRMLDTPALRASRDEGRIRYAEFATDPCASIFGRFFTRFRRRPTPNASVNVVSLGTRHLALTETPLPVEFDPVTLETVGVVGFSDNLGGTASTAHPHLRPGTDELVNFVLAFGRRSEYRIYRQRGTLTRELVGTVPADQPGYVHSFGITGRYLILAVFPLVVHPLSFLLRGRPFIENYRWRPDLGTRFVVLDLTEGTVVGEHRASALFAFHHLNAFERDGELVVDLCAYDDARIVDALYLDRLRAGGEIPLARPTRYRMDPVGGELRAERLGTEALELPRLNYAAHNGRDYRYAYGVGCRDGVGTDFNNQLVKLAVDSGETRTWWEAGCYPGEPVFVAAPDATDEDDGVVLSVVLDSRGSRSFLLVLAAGSFTELARAVVPHPIPFGLHGQFTRGN
jgi:beta,beta-carotene 9',10'-dioxygenase